MKVPLVSRDRSPYPRVTARREENTDRPAACDTPRVVPLSGAWWTFRKGGTRVPTLCVGATCSYVRRVVKPAATITLM